MVSKLPVCNHFIVRMETWSLHEWLTSYCVHTAKNLLDLECLEQRFEQSLQFNYFTLFYFSWWQSIVVRTSVLAGELFLILH